MNALTTENVPVPNSLSLVEDGLSIDKTVHLDSDATPEQSRRPVRFPLRDEDEDEDDYRSLGCYTEECQQNTSEFQWLRK